MEEVVEAALEKIQNTPTIGKLGLEVIGKEAEQTITLIGRVSSYYQKQIAQETIKTIVSPPLKLVNHITVVEKLRTSTDSIAES